MNATNNIATDLFYKIRSRFSGLKLGTGTGTITIVPEEARFFDFDYKEEDNTLGHISISLAEENSMKVYFSANITEDMDVKQKSNWYTFLKELREFAKRRLMSFDMRDISKDNLDHRDYGFLSKINKQNQIGESIMGESAMYGSKTVSYQKLLDTRLIIKHKNSLMDDQKPGARSRNISALFVENQEGERFKYPFIHLDGARAMQRHVANGGYPYDDVGKSIIAMSEEIAQLRSFSNYVVRNDLMNGDTNQLIGRSAERLQSLREQIKKLSKQKNYEVYRESFSPAEQITVPDEVVEDFTNKFTVKNFKEDIKNVFPILYKLSQIPTTVEFEDIISDNSLSSSMVESNFTPVNELEEYENWINSIGENTSDEVITQLQSLVQSEFTAGKNGDNAIPSLEGISIDGKSILADLEQPIVDQSEEDPDFDVRGLLYSWLEQNSPHILDELDWGDFNKSDTNSNDETDDVPEEESTNSTAKDQLNVNELAEFIHSFYDRNTNTFPKGPEGVCSMVGKRFGEQAEMVARRMVERLAPQQMISDQPVPLEQQELVRIKQLSGLQTEDNLNEFLPALGGVAMAGLRMLAPTIGRMFASGAASKMASSGLSAVGNVAKKAAGSMVNKAASAAPGVAGAVAGKAPQLASGAAIWDAYNDVKKKFFGGDDSKAGETFDSKNLLISALEQVAGNAVKGAGPLVSQLADLAVKYALPIGVVLAIINYGSKILGAMFDDMYNGDEPMSEDSNEQDLANSLQDMIKFAENSGIDTRNVYQMADEIGDEEGFTLIHKLRGARVLSSKEDDPEADVDVILSKLNKTVKPKAEDFELERIRALSGL